MELEELNRPKIVSERLLERMTNEERRGLDWLTQILSESAKCELEPDYRIIADYSDTVDLVLDVEETVKMSIKSEMSGPGVKSLAVFARSKGGGELAKSCIIAKDHGKPVTDHCASFVLWSDSGFNDMPGTLETAIEEARGYSLEFIRELYTYAAEEVRRMRWREVFEYAESFDTPPRILTLERAKLDMAMILSDPDNRVRLDGEVEKLVWEFIYGGEYYGNRGGT